MTIKKRYKSRKWLSPDTTAFIHTEVGFDFSWGATLKIGDCQRIVNLDVYVDDVKSQKRSLKKLNLLRDEIGKLITAVEAINYG